MVNSSTSGLHVNDIAKRLKLSQQYTKDTLANARRRGLIGLVRASRQSVWVPLHLADAIAKAMAEESKRKERECDRRRRLRLAERIDDELEEMPQQRWMPVNAPLPFRLTAPNSVFALGQQLRGAA